MFADYDARAPFERAPNIGFRLASYERPLTMAELGPVRLFTAAVNAKQQKPVGDEIFEVYRRQYAYDPAPLNAIVEATEETTLWVRLTVAFDAAYGGERMRAHLFLPRSGRAPTPELDPRNYAPRIRVPTLMVSGRYDFEMPYETTQRPLFELLGPPAEHKHLASVETGHAVPAADLTGTILPWLDRYLGRVER